MFNIPEYKDRKIDTNDALGAILTINKISRKLSANVLIEDNPVLVQRCKSIAQDSGFMAYKLVEQLYKNTFL